MELFDKGLINLQEARQRMGLGAALGEPGPSASKRRRVAKEADSDDEEDIPEDSNDDFNGEDEFRDEDILYGL